MSTHRNDPGHADMHAGNGPSADAAQYLTFLLAGEEYGVEILRVQEIKGWEGVTRVPHTPRHLLGVMNLRGTVVPVVDLRARFGLPQVPFGPGHVVIVVRVQVVRGEKTVGVVVDGVSEVYHFAAADIQPPPQVRSLADPSLIAGLASVADKMVMLLDIDRLVATSIEAEPASARTH
jgi:purine-binding chemotaxis protein CheW